MKTAIYIEDGITQLVLTPETAIDRQVLDTIGTASERGTRGGRFTSYRGEFYACQGGWTRWAPSYSSVFDNVEHRLSELSKQSLILRVDMRQPAESQSETVESPA